MGEPVQFGNGYYFLSKLLPKVLDEQVSWRVLTDYHKMFSPGNSPPSWAEKTILDKHVLRKTELFVLTFLKHENGKWYRIGYANTGYYEMLSIQPFSRKHRTILAD